MSIRLVILGDIVGNAGRSAVVQQLPVIRERWGADLVVANAENSANGSGLTPEQYGKLCRAGLDGMTLGDHVYRKKQIVSTLETEGNIIRPANLPRGAKGREWMKLEAGEGKRSVYFLTVLGRLFMNGLQGDDPFAAVERVIRRLPEVDPIVVVEIHAEATSEKKALGWYFDGKVSVVFGTHTHVATADARVLPKGTGYITDLGMSGPEESVLGRRVDRVLTHMTTAMPAPFDTAEGDPRVCGVFVEIDEGTRRVVEIERVELKADVNKPPFVAG